MHKLLRFNPEPFEDAAELQGEHECEGECATYETEEESGVWPRYTMAPATTFWTVVKPLRVAS
jgi:hypothetical protein